MQLVIISLNSKVIYLEVHSLESYRRLGSIFRTKENGNICFDQIADQGFKSRLSDCDLWDKKNLCIKYELNNIPLDSKFIIVPHKYANDTIDLYLLKGFVQEINGESSDIRPNVDQLKALSSHYSMHLFDGSSRITTYIGNMDRAKRVCRFCRQAMPETLFKHKSHAISEALGYKSLVCNEECDECNERFSRTIEPDVVNMNSFLLSVYGVSGKKGVRKTSGANFKLWLDRSNCQYDSQGTFVMQLDDLHIDKTDIKASFQNLPPLDTSSLKFVPQNVYKCFCKYVISCLDQNQIAYFQKTIDWINAPTKYRKLPLVAYCLLDHISPLFVLFIRKCQDYRYPYCFAFINIASVRYMFIVPFSSQDRYRFTTELQQQFFRDAFRSWFPAFDIQSMRLSSSKATHTAIKTTFTIEDGCKLGRDYFIMDTENE